MKLALKCQVCDEVFERYPSRAGPCCSRDCLARFANAARQTWLQETRGERFWSKVRRGRGCWCWTGSVGRHGYGQLKLGGRQLLAHRVAWGLSNEDPGVACVLHRCDNPICVRPDHLFLGTKRDNSDDMISKGRASHPAGAQCVRRKLDQGLVDEIRSLRDLYKQTELALKFQISQSHVSRILRGVTWRP